MNDKEFVSYLLSRLSNGDKSIITDDNVKRLNDIALCIYNIPELNDEQKSTLKDIIYCCNIFYNRTDMEVLPINNSFYDLLNEKYKTYDPNFQVGSLLVNFGNMNNINDSNHYQRELIKPFHFRENNLNHKSEFHEELFNEITKFHKLDNRDFHISPIKFLNNDISKRLHNTQHNHPSLVGTLDKAKFVMNSDAMNAGAFYDDNVKIFERDFIQDHIQKGIISPDQEIEIVCELKYDGISIEADCGFEVVSARTRGDTGLGEAADMSPILAGYPFRHAICMNGEKPIGVKFEAIITKDNLSKFNALRGQNYANGRTAIIGLFGASDAYKFRNLITLVPLAVDREDTPYISNRLEEIEFLNKLFVSHGCPLRYCYFKGTVNEILYYVKAFVDEAAIARDYLNFMYDGVVVSYVDEEIRNKLGRKNYVNKYSIAIKFDPLCKQTTFRGYTYTVGQNGQVTPMIHYDPVEFRGTIHTKSTGSSLDRFNELGLKIGDYINVTYVNDVMPYVSKLECDHNRNNPNPVESFIDYCPECGSPLVISDSGKTKYCSNMDCRARAIARMTNMFSKMNIKGFAEAAFNILYDNNIRNFHQLFNVIDYVSLLGDADGANMISVLNDLQTKPIDDYIIIGALGFSGIAQKKWKSILEKISIRDILQLYLMYNSDEQAFINSLFTTVPNIGEVTCYTIVKEFKYFAEDIMMISNWTNIINSFGKSGSKIQIRFTGCRNLQLSQQLINLGYDADGNGSVTKSTNILIVPYEGFKSNKTSKVNDQCLIIPIDQFINNMDSILSDFS